MQFLFFVLCVVLVWRCQKYWSKYLSMYFAWIETNKECVDSNFVCIYRYPRQHRWEKSYLTCHLHVIREQHGLSRIRNCHRSLCSNLESVGLHFKIVRVVGLRKCQSNTSTNTNIIYPPNLVVWLAVGKGGNGERVTTRLRQHGFTEYIYNSLKKCTVVIKLFLCITKALLSVLLLKGETSTGHSHASGNQAEPSDFMFASRKHYQEVL